MSTAEAIKVSMNLPMMVVNAYLGDLSNEELLVRPVPGANHIAWQLGHLLQAQNHMLNQVAPGSLPPLPEGFAEKYSKDTASVDDSSAFESKDKYLELIQQQHTALLAALDNLSDEELAKPAPEGLQQIGGTVAAIIIGQITHWMMHAGQWAVLRRKLGREALF